MRLYTYGLVFHVEKPIDKVHVFSYRIIIIIIDRTFSFVLIILFVNTMELNVFPIIDDDYLNYTRVL